MADATAEVVQQGVRQFGGLFSEMFVGTGTIDVGNLIDAAGETNAIDVPGVALGDMVIGIAFSVSTAGLNITPYVSAANVVSVRFQNESGVGADLASCTVKVLVGRPAW